MEAGKTINYNTFYREAYEFHKRWMPFPADTEDWVKCAEDIGQTSARNGNHPFMMDLLTAVMGDLERAYKDNQQGGQTKCG